MPPSSNTFEGHKNSVRARALVSNIYVSDYSYGLVYAFSKETLAGEIWDGLLGSNAAEGIAVDPSSNLYVGNLDRNAVIQFGTAGNQNRAPIGNNVVPTGFYDITPYGEIIGGSVLADVAALAATTSNIYVGISTGPSTSSLTGVIVVFPNLKHPDGHVAPQEVISAPLGTQVEALAVDANGGVYMQYAASHATFPITSRIMRYDPGQKTGVRLPIVLGEGGRSLAIDAKGNLVACDIVARAIEIFAPGSSKPSRSIADDCGSFALSADGSTLFATEQPLQQEDPGVPLSLRAIDYATGKVLYSISKRFDQTLGSNTYPGGVAVAPPAPPGPPYR